MASSVEPDLIQHSGLVASSVTVEPGLIQHSGLVASSVEPDLIQHSGLEASSVEPDLIQHSGLEQGGHALENRENRENGEKKSLQEKLREFEILLKIREKSGNLKKSYLCKVKIFKFYSCSGVATGGFFLPYA